MPAQPRSAIVGFVASIVLAAVLAAPAGAVTAGSFAGRADGAFALVGAHLEPTAADQTQSIRLYFCNSAPFAEWFVGKLATDGKAELSSASGDATASVTVTESTISGTVRPAGASAQRFSIHRARGGAGIYQVTVTRDNRIAGRSLAGDVFVARRTGKRVRGWVVDRNNRVREYRAFDVMRLTPRALRSGHLPTRYAGYTARSLRPGAYMAVAAQIKGERGTGLGFFGRDIGVLTGTPSAQIIGLTR